MIEKAVAFLPMERRIGAILSLDPPFQGARPHNAFDDPRHLLESFQATSERAIVQGADVVISAEDIIAAILTGCSLTRFQDAPVIDVFGVTWSYAVMPANLRAKAGMGTTCRGWYARPDVGLIRMLGKR